MDNNRVSNLLPKPRDTLSIGRGAFHRRRRYRMTYAGVYGNANVGISNDKECEMHSRRKTKVSRATLIGPGSVGS